MNKKLVLLLCFLELRNFQSFAQTHAPTDVPFPTCGYSRQTCPNGCVEVPIRNSHTGGYSTDNVLCINNKSPTLRPYRLTGCPIGYFNTMQNTSGVCTRTNDNTTDLILTIDKLVPGLHLFNCLGNTSGRGIISRSAIVGK